MRTLSLRAVSRSLRAAMSFPARYTVPPVRGSCRIRLFRMVDLPAPLGPMRVMICPWRSSSPMPPMRVFLP